jgi:methyltransferase
MRSVPPPWFVGLVVLTGLQRLRELNVSRQNLGTQSGDVAASGSFPAMVAVNVALFLAPLAEASVRGRRVKPHTALAWTTALGAATWLRWWSIRSLGRSWNVRGLVPHGFEPVARGPYRLIRHPNYVAVILEFVALPLAGGAWVSALVLSALNGLLLARRIPAEERLLERSERYRELFSGRARFIPGLF